MNTMVEVLYRQPRDVERERSIHAVVSLHHGRFEFFEETMLPNISENITLTFVFPTASNAENAALALKALNYHVVFCGDYPD